jgi:hypothetical protein
MKQQAVSDGVTRAVHCDCETQVLKSAVLRSAVSAAFVRIWRFIHPIEFGANLVDGRMCAWHELTPSTMCKSEQIFI